MAGNVHRGEYVFNAPTTARYRPAFDLIHQGAKGQDIARAFLAIDQNGKLVRQGGDPALVKEVVQMRSEMVAMRREMSRVADRYESHSRVGVEGELKMEHGVVSASLRQSNRLRRATG